MSETVFNHTPARHGWKRDMEWARAAEAVTGPHPVMSPEHWRRGLLAAIVSRDPISQNGKSDLRWHISLQHRDRVPTWEELSRAAHELRPGVVFAAGVPPRSWWINIHPHVLHLWEIHDDNLAAQWRFERMGHEPT
jgi:hypothetical protein